MRHSANTSSEQTPQSPLLPKFKSPAAAQFYRHEEFEDIRVEITERRKVMNLPIISPRKAMHAALLFLFILSVIIVSPLGNADSNKYIAFEDKEFFFTTLLPSDWTIKRSKDISSTWRISAVSPDGKSAVAIYAVKGHNDIDIDRLAGADHRLFSNLGEVTNSTKIKKHLFWTKAISKTYSKNRKGIQSTGYFTADGTYGYAILAFSSSGDFSATNEVANSFKSNVPFFTNLKNKLSGKEGKSSSEIVLDLIMAIFLFAIPVGLGFVGYMTRRHSWGLALCIMLPLAAGIALLTKGLTLWGASLVVGMIFVLMFAGRYGVIMWVED